MWKVTCIRLFIAEFCGKEKLGTTCMSFDRKLVNEMWHIPHTQYKMSNFSVYKFGRISKIFALIKSKVWDTVNGECLVYKNTYGELSVCVFLIKDVQTLATVSAWVGGCQWETEKGINFCFIGHISKVFSILCHMRECITYSTIINYFLKVSWAHHPPFLPSSVTALPNYLH